ncbi:MAG: hypothetical protein ABWY25_02185 [Paenisporosarcina sp.]
MIIDEETYKAVNEIEHDVFEEEKTDEFLEHFGVKGQRWGQRKEKRRTKINARKESLAKADADFKARPIGQKAALAAATVGAAWALSTRMAVRGRSPLTTVLVGTAAGVAGYQATRHILDSNGSISVSALN